MLVCGKIDLSQGPSQRHRFKGSGFGFNEIFATLQEPGPRNPSLMPNRSWTASDKAESYRVQGFGFRVCVVLFGL